MNLCENEGGDGGMVQMQRESTEEKDRPDVTGCYNGVNGSNVSGTEQDTFS